MIFQFIVSVVQKRFSHFQRLVVAVFAVEKSSVRIPETSTEQRQVVAPPVLFCSAVMIGTFTACLPLTANWLAYASVLVSAILLIAGVLFGWRGAMLVVILLMAWCSMTHALNHRLPPGLNRQEVIIRGTLERITMKEQLTFVLIKVHHCQPRDTRLPDCNQLRRVKLGWANPPRIHVGEEWTLHARVQEPHSALNPEPFLSMDAYFHNAIGATGKVWEKPPPTRLHGPLFPVRRWVGERLSKRLTPHSAERWVRGLVLGETSVFTQQDWQLLNDSGTVHLVVVSGMHIGFLILGSVRLIRGVLRFVRPFTWRLAHWPWLPALCAGAGYVVLSGNGPAAERAWIMMLAIGWASTRHYPLGAYASLWLALGTIILIEPLAVFRPGLWLSFIAVLTLLVGWRWRRRRSGPLALLQTQLTLGIVMDGVVMLFFGQWMPASLIANLLAIPWVTLIMLPSALIATLLELLFQGGGAAPVWWCFKMAVSLFESWLSLTTLWLPAVPIADERRVVLGLSLVLLGSVWLLPGVRLCYRFVMCLALVPMLLWGEKREALVGGDLLVRIHDVGQGQLIDIQTAHHRLLYDTGPRFHSGDMPINRLWHAPQYFDRVIVSHGDLDHSGGVPVLLEKHRVGEWMVPSRESLLKSFSISSPVSLPLQSRLPVSTSAAASKAPVHAPDRIIPCRKGQSWTWDNVDFRLLWPVEFIMKQASENQRSCILLIRTGNHHVLIPGDADAWVERHLLNVLDELQSRNTSNEPLLLLVSGHHGSRTSSSVPFMMRARPRHVVHSAGFLNRYGHPAETIVQRMSTFAECQWSTALEGALTLRIRTGQATIYPEHVSAGIREECLRVSSSG